MGATIVVGMTALRRAGMIARVAVAMSVVARTVVGTAVTSVQRRVAMTARVVGVTSVVAMTVRRLVVRVDGMTVRLRVGTSVLLGSEVGSGLGLAGTIALASGLLLDGMTGPGTKVTLRRVGTIAVDLAGTSVAVAGATNAVRGAVASVGRTRRRSVRARTTRSSR